MRKLLFLFVFTLVPVFLFGCSSRGTTVVKVTMYVSDQIANATVEIVPDYAGRTLDLTYKKDDLEAKKDEVATVGQVGDEYFDRFEKIVKFVAKNSDKTSASGAEMDKNQGVFKIVVEKSDKDADQFETYWNDPINELEELRDFYLDITILLTEAEQV